MIRTGTVVKEEKNGVMVCFERLAACAGCNACGRDKKETTVFVYGHAKPGDIVTVQMPDAQVLRASLLTYLLPLSGFIGGLFLGAAIFGNKDWAMVLGGLLGLSLCAIILKIADKRLGLLLPWQPHIVAAEDTDTFTTA